jgi:hypothetical protein
MVGIFGRRARARGVGRRARGVGRRRRVVLCRPCAARGLGRPSRGNVGLCLLLRIDPYPIGGQLRRRSSPACPRVSSCCCAQHAVVAAASPRPLVRPQRPLSQAEPWLDAGTHRNTCVPDPRPSMCGPASYYCLYFICFPDHCISVYPVEPLSRKSLMCANLLFFYRI